MKKEISSFSLHIIAMATMLIDHIGIALLPQYEWLRYIGRLAFPIFAFMIVEGYIHTHDFDKYLLRIVGSALISEIPFNLMNHGTVFWIDEQNVLFALTIGLLGIWVIDKIRTKEKGAFGWFFAVFVMLFCGLLERILNVEFLGVGSMLVIAFYFFRKNKWYCYIGKVLSLLIFSSVFVWWQIFGVLSLVVIFLYNGNQGYHKKWFQRFCYLFYPVHLLGLYLIGLIM